jgi:hypothetical protein
MARAIVVIHEKRWCGTASASRQLRRHGGVAHVIGIRAHPLGRSQQSRDLVNPAAGVGPLPSHSQGRPRGGTRLGLADGLYSCWDCRRLAFPKNQGLRIDLILASPSLARRLHGNPDRPQRAEGQDHAPVIAEFGD